MGGLQDTWFVTEEGVYEILFISRKPIAKEFKKWLRKTKQIRLNSDKILKDKIKELEFYKEPSYQELPMDEAVYCVSTDIENVKKVGKTTKTSKIRKDQLQTACVNNVEILYEVKTSNCSLLETLIHYSLHKYRLGKREHFNCSIEHIKFVMDKCAKFVNTIGSIRQNINDVEFTQKLGMVIVSDKIVEKEKIIKKIVYKTKFRDSNYQTSQCSDFDIDEFLSELPQKCLIQELN